GSAFSGAAIFEATLLRLLETYRYDTFRHGKHRAILARSPARSVESEPREDLSAGVRNALLAAHKAMYPGKTREEFCVMMAESVKAFFGGGVSSADLHSHKVR